jgi:hypothetical protein
VSVLRLIDPIGPELLRLDAWTLLGELGGPTLARFPGAGTERPRAVVVLQHADERTGLDALLEVLSDHPPLSYDLHILFGNVEAALAAPGFAHRMLSHQPDMNRAWHPDGHARAGIDRLSVANREALRHLLALDLSALVDLHNTTGENPFHAIVGRRTSANIGLAALFTPLVVLWDQHRHTLMEALGDHCANVAIECGRVGSKGSHQFAVEGLRRFLAAPDPDAMPVPPDVELLSRMRRVEIDPQASLRFGGVDGIDVDADVVIAVDVELRNGEYQEPGWLLATVRPGRHDAVRVLDTDGSDVTDEMLFADGDELRVRVGATPLMMTRTIAATRADCLTYLLDRID